MTVISQDFTGRGAWVGGVPNSAHPSQLMVTFGSLCHIIGEEHLSLNVKN